jgi:hypothetical protein
MKNLLVKKIVLFLIRSKLHLKKYERFRFSNQKSNDIYHFDNDMLVKETNYGHGKEAKSNVSLNFLLSDEVDVYKI